MEHNNLDILQILLQSGLVVKFVLVSLIFCSVLSWTIIFKKKKEFKTNIDEDNKFNDIFKNSDNLNEIYDNSKGLAHSSMSKMFQAGFDELSKIREKLKQVGKESHLSQYLQENGTQALERSLKQGANDSYSSLNQRLSLLASIGSVSPFIGLFGTVWGIIDSFTGLASGGGSIEAVAPGIAEALVATAVGLAAAIPAVAAYNIFITHLTKQNSDMENFGQEFLNLIERSVLIKKG